MPYYKLSIQSDEASRDRITYSAGYATTAEDFCISVLREFGALPDPMNDPRVKELVEAVDNISIVTTRARLIGHEWAYSEPQTEVRGKERVIKALAALKSPKPLDSTAGSPPGAREEEKPDLPALNPCVKCKGKAKWYNYEVYGPDDPQTHFPSCSVCGITTGPVGTPEQEAAWWNAANPLPKPAQPPPDPESPAGLRRSIEGLRGIVARFAERVRKLESERG